MNNKELKKFSWKYLHLAFILSFLTSSLYFVFVFDKPTTIIILVVYILGILLGAYK